MNWASILDEGTREQAILTSGMPFVQPYLALMPDAHLGRGATVGSVIPTVESIMPAAVGVDIGCGMVAARVDGHKRADFVAGRDLSGLREQIERSIPLSAGHINARVHGVAVNHVAELEQRAKELGVDPDRHASKWRRMLGSLGSGNHFIEVSADEEENIWIFLHSGSRGVGNRIAQHYIKQATLECQDQGLPDQDLSYLREGTPEFDSYMAHLTWAQEFAFRNREVMLDRVHEQVSRWLNAEVTLTDVVNCHHNYTVKETINGQEVYLSRKGAISAQAGDPGLIPGSMGDKSYIVRGLGNEAALNSAPHGAGRNHSRTVARTLFTQDDLRERMEGIEYRDTEAFLDEHPLAYKPIDQVMEDAKDLVEIVHTLKQIINVKGD